MHPVIFEWGPFKIYSYGLMVSLGFLTAILLIILRREEIKLKVDEILDLATWVLVAGIIGARLFHVLLNLEFYLRDPKEIIMLHHGGLAYQGGLISAILASVWFLKRRNYSFFKMADYIMPFVALGHSIGRIGCFLNGCCYGKESFNFGVLFPDKEYPVYPTEIYYSFSLLAIFVILNFMSERKKFEGEIFSLYLLLYGIMRVSIDFLRGDLYVYPIGLTMTQMIGTGFIVFSIFLSLYLKRYEKNKP